MRMGRVYLSIAIFVGAATVSKLTGFLESDLGVWVTGLASVFAISAIFPELFYRGQWPKLRD